MARVVRMSGDSKGIYGAHCGGVASRAPCAIGFTTYIPWLPERTKRQHTPQPPACAKRAVAGHALLGAWGSARTPRRSARAGVGGLLADGKAGEAANDDVLAGRGGQLVAQLLHGLA